MAWSNTASDGSRVEGVGRGDGGCRSGVMGCCSEL